LLVAFLIGFDALARIVTCQFLPLLASALFAGTMLRVQPLALVVPVAAMLISDAIIGFDDWRITTVVYLRLSCPRWWEFFAALVSRACSFQPSTSLIFFVTTNIAVGIQRHLTTDMAFNCATSPHYRSCNIPAGDLVWAVILFAALARRRHLRDPACATAKLVPALAARELGFDPRP
jgi:hypothetical protein